MRANNMAAMILAGGRGSRLHELTKFCFASKRMESVSLFVVMETVNDQSDHV